MFLKTVCEVWMPFHWNVSMFNIVFIHRRKILGGKLPFAGTNPINRNTKLGFSNITSKHQIFPETQFEIFHKPIPTPSETVSLINNLKLHIPGFTEPRHQFRVCRQRLTVLVWKSKWKPLQLIKHQCMQLKQKLLIWEISILLRVREWLTSVWL